MGRGWRRARVTLEACVERRSCAPWVRPPRPRERIRELVDAGMDVARLNMSHGTHEDHDAVPTRLVRGPQPTSSGHGVGILADLQGPKIRLGDFAAGPVRLAEGGTFTITTRDVPGDADDLRRRRTRACPATWPPATRSSSTTAGSGCGSPRSDGTDVVAEVAGRRQGEQPQGHQPAGRRGQRPGDVGEGHRGPALRAAPQRRLHRAVVRAQRRATSRTSAGSWPRRASRSRSSPRSRSRRPSSNLDEIVEAFDGFMVAAR